MLIITHLVHLAKVWIYMPMAVRKLQIVEIDYLWVPNFLEKCKSPSLCVIQKYTKNVTFSPRMNNHRDFSKYQKSNLLLVMFLVENTL